MEENFTSIDKKENLESEIAELEAKIEDRRRQLESQEGIVNETPETHKEVIKESLQSKGVQISSSDDQGGSTGIVLDGEDEEKVNDLIEMMRRRGIKTTVKKIINEPAHIVDAFHDSLVNHLYEELVKRGIVK